MVPLADGAADEPHEEIHADEPTEEDFHAALLALEDEDPEVPSAGYVVAKTQRGSFRRVHRVGGCKRIPGEHFLDWECFDTLPPAYSYNARCLHCFPADKASVREEELLEGSSVGSASSSEDGDLADGGAEAETLDASLAP